MYRIEFVENLTVNGIAQKSHRNKKTNVIFLDASLSGAERRAQIDRHVLKIHRDLLLTQTMVPFVGPVD